MTVLIMRPICRLKERFKGFSLVELIAVFTILAIVGSISIVYFTGVGKKSSDTVVEVTLSEIAKLAVSENRIEGELSIEQISEFSTDFRDSQGDAYSVKQGTVSLQSEISVYIPQSKSFVNLAAISNSGKCVFISFPLVGSPSKQIVEASSCNAETIINS